MFPAKVHIYLDIAGCNRPIGRFNISCFPPENIVSL